MQFLGILVIASWSGIISGLYFFVAKQWNMIRLTYFDELLGGDIHYFAPIKMHGHISNYINDVALDDVEKPKNANAI